ncbi:MAG: polymer-forming cytoskeletal protein [Candidatus Krumholzibacteriaceae bacterium]
MFALCNCAAGRVLAVIAGLFAGGVHAPSAAYHHVSVTPGVVVCAPAPADSAAAQKSQKPAKPQKPEKPTKITISDEGIKIESEGSKKVVVDVGGKMRGKIGRTMHEDLDSLKSNIESLDTVFGDQEDKRYYNVKSSDQVQFGQRIVVGPHDLVNGDVVTICSSITIEGKVMGDVAAICGNVELGPTAVVNGHHHNRSGLNVAIGPFGEGLLGAGGKIAVLIVTMLLMLIILYFLGQRMKIASDHAGRTFFKSFGLGLLVLIGGTILVVVLAIILAITIVGIPVAVLLVLSYAALLVLGYFVAALALGSFVCRKCNIESDSVYVHGLLGLILLSIVGIIASFMLFTPLMGPLRWTLLILAGLIKCVALASGMGAFIVSRAGSLPGAPKAPLPAGTAGTGPLPL